MWLTACLPPSCHVVPRPIPPWIPSFPKNHLQAIVLGGALWLFYA